MFSLHSDILLDRVIWRKRDAKTITIMYSLRAKISVNGHIRRDVESFCSNADIFGA